MAFAQASADFPIGYWYCQHFHTLDTFALLYECSSILSTGRRAEPGPAVALKGVDEGWRQQTTELGDVGTSLLHLVY